MTTDTTTVTVGIFNLQVILAKEGSAWVAQAIEIDYAAGGASIEDAKKKFEGGLTRTLQEHFQLFGNVDGFLTNKAPASDWLDLIRQPATKFSQVSVHEFIPPVGQGRPFPFGQISYYAATKPEPLLAGM